MASDGPSEAVKRTAVALTPRDTAERESVHSLALDVWTEHELADQPIVVVLDRPGIEQIEAAGIAYEIVVDDIDEVARAEKVRLSNRMRVTDGSGWFNEYRDVMEIRDKMDLLHESHPTIARIKRIGTSVEGWPIRALEVGRGDIGIVLNGGQHAREWISVMVTMCVADRLVRKDSIDDRIRGILDKVTFHIAPLINPDGYVHSWNVNRYWRKNRRGGHGVDLNRNYGVAWGKSGSSRSKRSDTYRGESAFSEPESQAVRLLFETENISSHIDFHSYSQLILYPWNYTRTSSPDRDKLTGIADRMSSAMYAEHEHAYKILAGSGLYPAGGTLSDWVYGEKKALSFTVELRPGGNRGRGGFVLPPEQIVPTCDESLAAVLELADWTVKDVENKTRETSSP